MEFYIRDKEQAQAIINAYNACKGCDKCVLNGSGWHCSYVYDRAVKYMTKHADK